MTTRSQRPSPSAELSAFAQRQVQNARIILGLHRRSSDRRAQQRNFLVEPVHVQPIDEQFQPIGEPIAAVTRDISPEGIGLIFQTPTAHDLLSLRFAMDGVPQAFVIKIIWRKPMGPFHYVGGQKVKG